MIGIVLDMIRTGNRIHLAGGGLLAVMLLAACTSTGVRQAPIAEREPPARTGTADVVAAPPSTREARDGVYVVQKGDTLRDIAAAFGRDHRDIARWNNIDDPNKLTIGQGLRVIPPAETAVASPVTPATGAQSRPLTPPASGAAAAPGNPATPPMAATAPSVTPAPAAPETGLTWMWPLPGKVVEKFDDKRNKGIDIAAREGDPVLAASDGNVVYSGSSLRGYGNLVIVKHNDEFISAYAHNRQILVKQGQAVKRGQRIAEAGKSDASTPKLHFEIRRGGKPVDPLQYLPPR
jgi:lipoprotein NlpD